MKKERNWQSKGSREKVSSASALHTLSKVVYPVCEFCSKKHKSEKCFETLKLSALERAEKMKSAGLCFKCLKKGHLAKGCLSKCKKCKGKHNIIMCGIKLDSNRDNDSTKVAVENRSETVNQGNSQGSSVNLAGAALQKCCF